MSYPTLLDYETARNAVRSHIESAQSSGEQMMWANVLSCLEHPEGRWEPTDSGTVPIGKDRFVMTERYVTKYRSRICSVIPGVGPGEWVEMEVT